MTRYENILAFTGFSRGAAPAVVRAAQFAAAHEGTLDVVHAASEVPREWLRTAAADVLVVAR